MAVYFLGAIGIVLEAFLGRFWVLRGEILSVETQLSIKEPVYGGDSSPTAIGWSILTTSEIEKWE